MVAKETGIILLFLIVLLNVFLVNCAVMLDNASNQQSAENNSGESGEGLPAHTLGKRQAYGPQYGPQRYGSPMGRPPMMCSVVNKVCTFMGNAGCHSYCFKRGFVAGTCNTRYLPDKCDCCRYI